MNKIITLFALLLALSTNSNAQGNLQFNQVINGELNAQVDYSLTTMGTITVPTGKVWKVESVSLSFYDGTYRYAQGNPVFIGNHCVNRLGVEGGMNYLPLWLSPGTYQVTATGFDDPFTFNYSVIEFNVTP